MDPVLQAFTGFMSENKGADGIPHRTPVIVFDMATGLYAMQAVQSTLYAQRNGGAGRKIEVSLMEAAAGIQAVRLLSGHRDGPFRIAGAPSGTFKTTDGWLQVIAVKNHEFDRLCKALDWPEVASDPRSTRMQSAENMRIILSGGCASNWKREDTAHWQELFNEFGVQNSKVLSYREFAEHPQPEAVGLLAWLVQPGSDAPWPIPNVPGMPKYVQDDRYAVAPNLGEHTREILVDAGYEPEAIEVLLKSGVVT